MNPRINLFALFAVLFTKSFSLGAYPKPTSNITVVGTVFCDACCTNSFSKNSYFLQGAKVLVECNFRVNSTPSEEISIKVDRITDKYGVYRVDIPPVDGFECRQGRSLTSMCRATLISSSSSLCSVPGLASSSEQLVAKCSEANLCVHNLNALSYRPTNRDVTHCGTNEESLSSSSSSSLNSSLFFWPPFFPSPLPFTSPPSLLPPLFPSPPSFPFPFTSPPSLLPPLFPSPPSFPIPLPPVFPSPPPSFPIPLPPMFPTPSPPSLPFPFPPLPPIFPAPSPPPPSFPFPPLPPLPPLLPPLAPIPPLFAPPPPPPSPPPPSFPFPFPPLPPLFPAPNKPSPPPLSP